MLQRLRIKNFALIESLDLEFTGGFNVFTGETGAGKSVLLGALNLLFGDRASSEMFREGEDLLFVEGNFSIPDQDEALIVRREMNRGGRSYAFVDDKQVTLQTLKETTGKIAELMGQHQHQSLLNPTNHLAVIDRFGDLDGMRGSFEEEYKEWKKLRSEIDNLVSSKQQRLQKIDYLKFQLSEIEAARLQSEEEAELNSEQKILKNAETLKELSSEIYSLLYDETGSVFEKVNKCFQNMRKLRNIDANYPVKEDELNNLSILSEEIGKQAAAYYESIEADPQRLEWIEFRLDSIQKLKNKYGGSIDEILRYAEEIRKEIDFSDNFDIRIDELKKQLDTKTGALIEFGEKLDAARKKAAGKLSSELKKLLAYMGMGKMSFETRFDTNESGDEVESKGVSYIVNESGLSQPEFMISPNPGEGLKPLSKIASGGELSRIMLAIKTALAERDNIGLLIFDEVDTGIGGEVAAKVGELLRKLSSTHQVLCITHLQQIASKGESHFAVFKKTEKQRTRTYVRKMEGKDRVEEIARLLSGDTESEETIAFAQKLLSESES
ncbi:MAG: DNA repair protein RecN [candidate division Zixibacteria bacterium]|nr:DNA repair protein RecN [candidate division Zixibacteria bacterium]